MQGKHLTGNSFDSVPAALLYKYLHLESKGLQCVAAQRQMGKFPFGVRQGIRENNKQTDYRVITT